MVNPQVFNGQSLKSWSQGCPWLNSVGHETKRHECEEGICKEWDQFDMGGRQKGVQ